MKILAKLLIFFANLLLIFSLSGCLLPIEEAIKDLAPTNSPPNNNNNSGYYYL